MLVPIIMLSDAIESPAKSNDPDTQYSMIQVHVLYSYAVTPRYLVESSFV